MMMARALVLHRIIRGCYLSIFIPFFFPPLDCEDESGALDHCWFIRVGFGLTSWSVDPTDQNPRCTQSCKAALHQIFFMLTFVFFVDSAHGLGLQAQKRYSHPLLFTSLLYLHPPPVYDFN
jgi:hypothetical protein